GWPATRSSGRRPRGRSASRATTWRGRTRSTSPVRSSELREPGMTDRCRRSMRTSFLILLALVCIPAASAAGPWLGTASNGVAEYTANVHGTTTLVGDGSNTVSVDGKWGLPRVTPNNGVGGLSADGRVLVLSQDFNPTGALQTHSSFLVLSTKPLGVRATVRLKGDFGFDALSPQGRIVYLIQHVSAEDLFQYRVRAYDLRAG